MLRKTFLAPLLAPLAFALALATPAPALAKRHAPALVFPMKADEYKKRMDARIDRILAAIDKKLDRGGVSSERKKEIHKAFEEVAKEPRDAIAKAAADGTVTEAEAKKITPLITGIRGNLREKLKTDKSGKPRSPTADAKHKGKSKSKDKSGKGDKPGSKDKAKDKASDKPSDKPTDKPTDKPKEAPSE